MQEKIQAEIISAMKEKNSLKVSTLKVLKGEIQRLESGNSTKLSDIEIKQVAKKLIDNIKLVNGSQEEIDILSEFAPKMLSTEELVDIINNVITESSFNGMKDLGKVMSYLSSNYPGQYDGTEASKLTKTALNG